MEPGFDVLSRLVVVKQICSFYNKATQQPGLAELQMGYADRKLAHCDTDVYYYYYFASLNFWRPKLQHASTKSNADEINAPEGLNTVVHTGKNDERNHVEIFLKRHKYLEIYSAPYRKVNILKKI